MDCITISFFYLLTKYSHFAIKKKKKEKKHAGTHRGNKIEKKVPDLRNNCAKKEREDLFQGYMLNRKRDDTEKTAEVIHQPLLILQYGNCHIKCRSALHTAEKSPL